MTELDIILTVMTLVIIYLLVENYKINQIIKNPTVSDEKLENVFIKWNDTVINEINEIIDNGNKKVREQYKDVYSYVKNVNEEVETLKQDLGNTILSNVITFNLVMDSAQINPSKVAKILEDENYRNKIKFQAIRVIKKYNPSADKYIEVTSIDQKLDE